MTLQEIIEHIDVKKIEGNLNPEITSIRFDSREVTEGDLFVATRGSAVDGHDYIQSAIEKGAVAIVCEKIPPITQSRDVAPPPYIIVENSLTALGKLASAWYGFPSSKLKLIGVTGTNGKTTIATLLYELFRKFGYKAGLLSTVCNYVDGKVFEATHTTPNPIELNGLLAEMVEAGCEYAFMEVSSHAIDQRRIAGLQFDGGVFTNITRDHIDYHKTFDAYLYAKKTFFDELPQSAFALTNLEDKNGMFMLQNTVAMKKTYSIRGLADFKGRIIEHSFEGMLLEINGNELYVPFVGKFNASNLLAVFGAAAEIAAMCGLPCTVEDILTKLSALQPVSGRFETIRSNEGYTVIIDYAHTPDALNNVLTTINQIRGGAGQLITVVGCGGNRDKGKRPMMAHEAVNASDLVILTSDNPREEDPQAIINDMTAGIDAAEKKKTIEIIDRRQAIKTACAMAKKDDVILVAGKGHEDYQIIGKEKFHFDDKEEVLKVIIDE